MLSSPSEKECKRCKINKPLTSFYKHKMMSDGRLNKCIECKKKDAINTRNKRIEYYREFDSKRYYENEHRRKPMNYKKFTQEHKNKTLIKWRKNNPLKYKAHRIVQSELKKGKITKPSLCYCCAEDKKLLAHHEDYNFPLFIHWVCASCHSAIHKLPPF